MHGGKRRDSNFQKLQASCGYRAFVAHMEKLKLHFSGHEKTDFQFEGAPQIFKMSTKKSGREGNSFID